MRPANVRFYDEAFWISPAGDIITVAVSHVAAVIADPGLFGLTAEHIAAEYAREGEPEGCEGRARRAIILGLVARGWVRVRRYPRQARWTVNLPSRGGEAMSRARSWAAAMLAAGAPQDDAVLLDFPGGAMECRLADLAEGLDAVFEYR